MYLRHTMRHEGLDSKVRFVPEPPCYSAATGQSTVKSLGQTALAIFVTVGVWAGGSSEVFGWSFEGHRAITRAALSVLPQSVPLDRDSASIATEGSVFPDLSRPASLPQLRDQQNPFISSISRSWGAPTPAYTIGLHSSGGSAGQLGTDSRECMDQASIGFLPYALVESTQLLATIFKQLRVDPSDRRLQLLALHYAGVLGHYSADLCQPLHTTVHYDGRALPGGESSRTGIHNLVDRLIETVPASTEGFGTTSSPAKWSLRISLPPLSTSWQRAMAWSIASTVSKTIFARCTTESRPRRGSPTSSANDFGPRSSSRPSDRSRMGSIRVCRASHRLRSPSNAGRKSSPVSVERANPPGVLAREQISRGSCRIDVGRLSHTEKRAGGRGVGQQNTDQRIQDGLWMIGESPLDLLTATAKVR